MLRLILMLLSNMLAPMSMNHNSAANCTFTMEKNRVLDYPMQDGRLVLASPSFS